MKCPTCEEKLEEVKFHGIKVDSCPSCHGKWFQKNELHRAKDRKEETLDFMDVDLWEKEENFKLCENDRICPSCEVPLYDVNYGDSDVKVDICNLCEGVWLDDGEFKKIVHYLKDEAGDKIMNDYARTLLEETSEVFLGPEPLREEVSDLLTVLGLLKYRIAGRHPYFSKTISQLPFQG